MSAVNSAEPGPPTSDHPLVRLRPITLADIAPWAAYLNLPEVYDYTSWYCPSADELLPHVWNPTANAAAGILRLAIAARSDDSLVGTIGFHSIDSVGHRAELAYDVEPMMWGKGIATAMCRTIVDWAFSRLSFRAVDAAVLHSNSRSIKVLENARFHFVRTAHGHRMVRGTPASFHLYTQPNPRPVPNAA